MKRTLLLLAMTGLSHTSVAVAASSGLLEQSLHSFVQARASSLPGKISLELGKFPESKKINACTRWEIFLPERARLWGQVSLGARCSEGPGQSLYIAARVKIEATAVLAARHIASGQTISADDLQVQKADLGTFPPDVVLHETDVIGRISRTAIAPGRPIQEGLLRQETVIEAGQTVRLILNDGELSVSNEGIAIGSAIRGQSVRVRLPSGRVITGVATGEGRVEVRP
jgi:flagella basal body P-ring formation protein FlgA